MDKSNIKVRLVFIKLNFQTSISQKCELGWFLLRLLYILENQIVQNKPRKGRVTVIVGKAVDDKCPVLALLLYLSSYQRYQTWSTLQLENWTPLSNRKIVEGENQHSPRLVSLQQTMQHTALHRSSNHGNNSRNTGLYNSDSRQMQKLVLSALLQNSSSRSIIKAVKMFHMTTVVEYQIQ